METHTEDLLTVSEAATVLRLNPQVLRRRLAAGELRGIGFRIFKRWRIRGQALLEWIADGCPDSAVSKHTPSA